MVGSEAHTMSSVTHPEIDKPKVPFLFLFLTWLCPFPELRGTMNENEYLSVSKKNETSFILLLFFSIRAHFFLSYYTFMHRTFNLGGLKGSNTSLLAPGTRDSNKTASSHKPRN